MEELELLALVEKKRLLGCEQQFWDEMEAKSSQLTNYANDPQPEVTLEGLSELMKEWNKKMVEGQQQRILDQLTMMPMKLPEPAPPVPVFKARTFPLGLKLSPWSALLDMASDFAAIPKATEWGQEGSVEMSDVEPPEEPPIVKTELVQLGGKRKLRLCP